MRQRSAVIGPNENWGAARPPGVVAEACDGPTLFMWPPERFWASAYGLACTQPRKGRGWRDGLQTATVGGPGPCGRANATIRALPRAAAPDRRPSFAHVTAT